MTFNSEDGRPLDESISVILLARNNESRLRRSVQDVIDVLCEVAQVFEILIIDDGSDDETLTEMVELEREFPPVKISRNQDPLGAFRTVQKGLELTKGEVIFVHDLDVPFSQESLKALWKMRHDPELVMARSRPKPPSVFRLRHRAGSKNNAFGQLQMIRRSAMVEMNVSSVNPCVTIDRVTRTDLQTARDVREPKLAARIRSIAYGE